MRSFARNTNVLIFFWTDRWPHPFSTEIGHSSDLVQGGEGALLLYENSWENRGGRLDDSSGLVMKNHPKGILKAENDTRPVTTNSEFTTLHQGITSPIAPFSQYSYLISEMAYWFRPFHPHLSPLPNFMRIHAWTFYFQRGQMYMNTGCVNERPMIFEECFRN